MSESKPSPTGRLRAEIGSLGADLQEMATLRWELARLELGQAVGQVRRLAVLLALAVGMGLVAGPLFAVMAADLLDGQLGIPRWGWLLIFGSTLLIGGAAVGYLAWRRFRQRFTGLSETVEELQEDIIWLKEWTQKDSGGET